MVPGAWAGEGKLKLKLKLTRAAHFPHNIMILYNAYIII